MANREKERAVYHVLPNSSGERWVVSKENSEFKREFSTKEEAEEFAKGRAREAELGQVKVHRKDGNMDYESTYGDDPARTPS
jgi:hypothetical protein